MFIDKNPVPLFFAGLVSLFCFALLALGVQHGAAWVALVDDTLMTSVQALITPRHTLWVTSFTEIGNVRLVIALTIFLVAYLFYKKRFIDGLWLGGTVFLAAVIVVVILKIYFARIRPTLNPLILETSNSFPSGHVTATTVFYWLLAFSLIFLVKRRLSQCTIVAAALLVILVVMFSRIYLGVHYPSDVFAGFFLGTAAVFMSSSLYFYSRASVSKVLGKINCIDKSIGPSCAK